MNNFLKLIIENGKQFLFQRFLLPIFICFVGLYLLYHVTYMRCQMEKL